MNVSRDFVRKKIDRQVLKLLNSAKRSLILQVFGCRPQQNLVNPEQSLINIYAQSMQWWSDEYETGSLIVQEKARTCANIERSLQKRQDERGKEERGQAHLPHPELINVEIVNSP
jgi:hypothetical protein